MGLLGRSHWLYSIRSEDILEMIKKILVKGPALSRSGYGEQTRFALRALAAYPDLFDVYLMNIPWGNTGQISRAADRSGLDSCLLKTA